ncbi:YSC84-related protein [Geobacter sp. SVR]|uniref:lipid-binding SYLF domain-containing protein n=1 Tax=Geobacter sp. SVR TaxID=2495594 RepID=UPI00143EF917|nr:YSC84-related protein [Geobacter sp. SVR]BCS52874.1 lipoprotein [Geobacter sp. SVR]GCF87497.1 lipoprotein [Geobacter sp. SVR]
MKKQVIERLGLLSLALVFMLLASPLPAPAADKADINRDADAALQKLYDGNSLARGLADKAQGVLIFPSIVKGGFFIGGQYGDGVLRQKSTVTGYYRSVAFSYGLQAGVQSFGYVLLFMNEAALDYLKKSDGWEIGVGPSVVVVDAGVAKTLTTTTAKDDIYAFIFDQKGLMAGIGLQGTKITKIEPK